MSKLYEQYINLKSINKNKLYLFKSGIFYIFLAEDAITVSSTVGLKLTKLNDTIVKCGFPSSAADKYFLLLKNMNYVVEIVDSHTNTIYTFEEYHIKDNIMNLVSQILKVDSNNLSIKDAYKFIDDIKEIANTIKL